MKAKKQGGGKPLSDSNAARRAARADRLACAAWARANREKVTARVRRWQLANPEIYAAQNSAAKARAKERKATAGQMTLPGVFKRASGQPARGAA